MEKNQFRAIYGIAVEKPDTVSTYILQQKLLKKLRSHIPVIQDKYGARWQDVWGDLEDRVLIMEKEELEESGLILDQKGIFVFKTETQKIINRSRYNGFSTGKKRGNRFLKAVKF